MLGPRRRACRQLPVHVVPSLARLLAVLHLGKSGRPLAAEMRPDRCLRAGYRQRNIQLSLRVGALPRLCLRVRGHLVSRLVARMPGVRRHEVQGHVTAAAPFQPVQVLPDSRACLARLSVRPPLHRLQRRLRVREKVDGSHRQLPAPRQLPQPHLHRPVLRRETGGVRPSLLHLRVPDDFVLKPHHARSAVDGRRRVTVLLHRTVRAHGQHRRRKLVVGGVEICPPTHLSHHVHLVLHLTVAALHRVDDRR